MPNLDLPLFEALITDEEDGIVCISLVDDPAVESNWLAFAKNKQPHLQFKVENEDEHIILGVVMRADFPIYRVGVSGFEYYIQYSKETIAKMTRKMLADNAFKFVDTGHNNQWVDGVELEELFIKDETKGINPSGFEDIENGSLFAKYRVSNEEIWDKVKAGEFKGFSLEGYFDIEEKVNNFQKQHKKNNMSLLERLKKILTEFKSFPTAEGVTIEVDAEELAVGQMVDVPDGEYHTDTVKVKVEQGVITEVETIEIDDPMPTEEAIVEDMACGPKKKKMAEDEPMPTEEQEPQLSPEVEALKNELQAEIDQLIAAIDEIKKQLEVPCVPPVDEIVKKEEEFSKKINNPALKYAEAIRKMK